MNPGINPLFTRQSSFSSESADVGHGSLGQTEDPHKPELYSQEKTERRVGERKSIDSVFASQITLQDRTSKSRPATSGSSARHLMRRDEQVAADQKHRASFTRAAGRGDLARIEQLLQECKFSRHDFNQALLMSARKGQVDVIRCLAKHGANVNFRTEQVSPLSNALNHGHIAAVRALIELGADHNDALNAMALEINPNWKNCAWYAKDKALRDLFIVRARQAAPDNNPNGFETPENFTDPIKVVKKLSQFSKYASGVARSPYREFKNSNIENWFGKVSGMSGLSFSHDNPVESHDFSALNLEAIKVLEFRYQHALYNKPKGNAYDYIKMGELFGEPIYARGQTNEKSVLSEKQGMVFFASHLSTLNTYPFFQEGYDASGLSKKCQFAMAEITQLHSRFLTEIGEKVEHDFCIHYLETDQLLSDCAASFRPDWQIDNDALKIKLQENTGFASLIIDLIVDTWKQVGEQMAQSPVNFTSKELNDLASGNWGACFSLIEQYRKHSMEKQFIQQLFNNFNEPAYFEKYNELSKKQCDPEAFHAVIERQHHMLRQYCEQKGIVDNYRRLNVMGLGY